MPSVLLAGASTYGVKNYGDDAMFKVLCDVLKEELPGFELVFLARHLHQEFDRTFGIRSIKNFEHHSREESIGRFFYGFNPGDEPNRLNLIRQELENADLLIIGGNSFMEVSTNEYLRGVASYSATLGIMAKVLNKPFALFGVHGHPISSEGTKQIARFLCNNAEIVTLREEAYRQNLLEIGCRPENLETWADPAFGLIPVEGNEKGLQILAEEDIELKKDRVIGVCFRHVYWDWDDDSYQTNAHKIANMCDFMIENFEAQILFTPNCTYDIDNPHEDDRLTCKFVHSLMKHPSEAAVVQADLQLPDRLSLYNLLDLVISNRRHVSTGAATHGVPFIALSTGHMWQFKPFMERLDMDQNQLVDFVEETSAQIQNKMTYVWTHGEEVSHRNTQALRSLRTIARNQVKRILEKCGLSHPV